MQNGYSESLNGKFRDERLTEHWVTPPTQARQVIDDSTKPGLVPQQLRPDSSSSSPND